MDMWVAKIKLVKIPRNGREIFEKIQRLFEEPNVDMKHYQADVGSDGFIYIHFNGNYKEILEKHGLKELIPHVDKDKELWLSYII